MFGLLFLKQQTFHAKVVKRSLKWRQKCNNYDNTCTTGATNLKPEIVN